MDFPGGIQKIEIADADDFDTAANSTFVIVADRSVIAEGTEFPDPESVTSALADDRELNMGKDQPINIRLTSLPTTDFDQLESAEQEPTELYIRVSSLRETDGGTPVVEVTYKKVILNHVNYAAINADRSEYGTVIADGMTTGSSVADIKDVVMN